MTKFQILDDDDDNRMLRDGERRTIHLMMKDGSPNPALSPVQRAIAATKEAMTSFDSAMHRKPGFYRPPITTAAMADAEKLRDDAYDTYRRTQADAWKSKSPPAGSYPEGSSSEGDPCSVNGSPGVLQAIDGHDGWLECVATDGNDHTDDSRTMHDTRTAQQIKDAAYAEYDASQREAYKRKG